MRVVLALFLLLSLSACADIDKSLYSLSDSVAPKDRVTGRRALNFADRSQQIQERNAAADKMLADAKAKGGTFDAALDAKAYARLQTVFRRVHSVSHLKDEKWKAVLVPDKSFNAFTMGGSYIFVNIGLMEQVQSDDELAVIIGHEIAHVTANHIYEQQAHTMAAALKGSGSVKKESFQAAFTLKNEEEADDVGLLYATLAGYDPYAGARIWQRMYESDGDFSARTIDHPTNSTRYKRNQQLGNTYKQYYKAGTVNPNHAAILETNEVFGRANAKPAPEAGKGGGLLALIETAGDTLYKHEQAKTERKKQIAAQQFIAYVGSKLAFQQPVLADAQTVQIPFTYTGEHAVKNLNLVAIAGQAQAKFISQKILTPNSADVAIFRFPSAQISAQQLQALKLAITHAE